MRHHWLICRAQNAEEMLSEGHETCTSTGGSRGREEIQVLSSGVTQGGPWSVRPSPLHPVAFMIGATELISSQLFTPFYRSSHSYFC